MKKVSFNTLGCRLNFSETGGIAGEFAKRGYEIVPLEQPADVVYLNTCTVTDGADASCRNMIRKAKQYSPDAKIVVTGCYAQMESEKIKEMPEVDLILGTSEKYNVFDYLESDDETIIHIDHSKDFWGAATSLEDSHTRSFLKIQDGCNYICSFCIIPFARGRSRTITIEEAVVKTQELVQSGFQEIVLTGVNIGEYEASSGQKLSDLVQAISQVSGLKRLRLSSVEPNTINDELLTVLKDSQIYQPHFHIPIQSGDPSILKSMRRKYTIDYYQSVLDKVHSYFPGAGVGADVIVGYPGESEKQFQNTYDFLKQSSITHFHVFPFSKRKGTTAAKLADQISPEIKKERVRKLIDLGSEKLQRFALNAVGKEHDVLFEKKNKQGEFTGYTGNFLKIKVKTNRDDLKNKIVKVRALKALDGELEGELL